MANRKSFLRIAAGVSAGVLFASAAGCADAPGSEDTSTTPGLEKTTSELTVIGPIGSFKPLPLEDPCRPDITDEPSLVVTDPDVLARFPLERTLQQIIDRAPSTSTTPLSLFQQWWASQDERVPGDPSWQPRCSDDGETINGFPIECPREERQLETHGPDTHEPVALFNRFDLAPLDGAHCGEYRIVYAKTSGVGGRNFIIFEGILPNPAPECGLEGCRPVAQFWADLSDADPADWPDLLDNFYYVGLSGFEPVVDPFHYGLGSSGGSYSMSGGQIRTNQFVQQPWTLREFVLERVCFKVAAIAKPGVKTIFPQLTTRCELIVAPTSVKANPHPTLWQAGDPLSGPFQTDFISSMSDLLPTPDGINDIGLELDGVYDAGESVSQFGFINTPNYTPDGAFTAAINAELAALGNPGTPPILSTHVARRAQTQACAGCHQLSSGQNLSNGVTWPVQSPSFVHVDESSTLSLALTMPGGFLDRRAQVLLDFLEFTCEDPCEGSSDVIFAREIGGDLLMLPNTKAALELDPKKSITFDGTLSGAVTH